MKQKKNKQITFDPEDIDRIQSLAAQWRTSFSATIRKIVAEYLRRLDGDEKDAA